MPASRAFCISTWRWVSMTSRSLAMSARALLGRCGNPIGHSPVAHLRVKDAAIDDARVDDERPHARKHPHRGRTRVLRCQLFEAAGEPERGAGAEHGFDVNVSPHHFDELPADREAEAGAAVLAGR